MTWNSKTVWWLRVEKGKKDDTDVPKLSPLDVSDRGQLEEGQAGYWASCRSVGRGNPRVSPTGSPVDISSDVSLFSFSDGGL